jgi:S1-C subfamily serine protease
VKNIGKTFWICLIVIICTGISLTACSNNETTKNIVYETIYNTVREEINVLDLYNVYLERNDLEDTDESFNTFLISLGVEYDSTKEAAKEAINSVVSVYSTFTKLKTYQSGFHSPTEVRTEDYSGAGAGVIYKADGNYVYIITNAHVLYDLDSVKFEDADGDNRIDANYGGYTIVDGIITGYTNTESGEINDTEHFANKVEIITFANEAARITIKAEIIDGDLENDIAVLRCVIDDFNEEVDIVDICETAVNPGETTIAIGNPLAEGIAVTGGMISKVSEQIEMTALDNDKKTITMTVIRTDATINSGNSGGGLFNLNGELIGITNAKIVYTGVENTGYAIPVSAAVEIAEQIIAGDE